VAVGLRGCQHMSKKKEPQRMNQENKSKGLVPRLRFPEFRDAGEWEERQLSHLTTKISDGIHTTPVYDKNGEYAFINGNNLVHGRILIDEKTKRVNLGEFNKHKKPLDENSILMSINGTIGNLAFFRGEQVILGKSACFIKIDSMLANKFFIYDMLQTEKVKHLFTSELTGSTIKNLSLATIKNIALRIPTLPEQKKIADCLSSLDELITTQAQKISTLKAHKKGLMQQLFPAEGENVPGLRFPEFKDAGEWEAKSFSKLFEIGSGKDYKQLSAGDIPVYGSGGYMLSVNDYLYDGESACIGRKGTINKPMFLTGKFWTVDTLFYTHSFENCLPTFVFLLFQNINWMKYNEAGGVPSLSKVIIKKIEACVPAIPEQQKIADCLSSFDELITTQIQKIDTLKEHKKGLMQGLFRSSDEVSV